jgi:general secretion pathway protein L
MPPAHRLLQASRTLWNLRQFDLASRHRGTRALGDAWKQWRGSSWKPVRYGLAGLVAAHLLGLNLWAWHQHAAIAAKQEATFALVKSTFPRVSENDIRRSAMLVMLREADTLRLQAGKPGDTDFEPMLQAAALAWPSEMPPVDNIRYEPGRLTLVASGWQPSQLEQFKNRLRPAGWQAEQSSEGPVVMTRLASTAP